MGLFRQLTDKAIEIAESTLPKDEKWEALNELLVSSYIQGQLQNCNDGLLYEQLWANDKAMGLRIAPAGILNMKGDEELMKRAQAMTEEERAAAIHACNDQMIALHEAESEAEEEAMQ